MQQIKRISTLLLVAVIAATLSGSASALAHGGEQPENEQSSVNSSQGRAPTNTSEHTVSPEKKAELRQKANDDLNKKREEHKDDQANKKEDRQKRCESHKQGLTNKFNNMVNHSQKIQAKIDNILNKATAYQASNGVTPTGWNDLLSAAQAAQAASADSIADLSTLKPTIDCNSESTASDVATFKAAAAKTRDNLKAYKTSVKALLKALKDAKPAESTEGSN
jgi:hypothetical protein